MKDNYRENREKKRFFKIMSIIYIYRCICGNIEIYFSLTYLEFRFLKTIFKFSIMVGS